MRVRAKTAVRPGASAVEMAVIAPVFVALVLGQIETSRLGMVAQLMTTAAREGCRVAVIQGSTQSDIDTRIATVLQGSGITLGSAVPTCPGSLPWNQAARGTPITISLSVPYSEVSWLGTPYFLTGATVSASATLSSENP